MGSKRYNVVTQKLKDGRIRVVSPFRYSLIAKSENLLNTHWIVWFGNTVLTNIRGEDMLSTAAQIAEQLASGVESPTKESFRKHLEAYLH